MHGLTIGWTWLLASGLASPTEPQHAFEYDAAPATIFVPVESIPLVPAFACPIPQGGSGNAGLGCVDGLLRAEDYIPSTDVEVVVEGLIAALAPFDVRVTTVRPPPFVPYSMILPTDELDMEGTSRTCVAAGIDCDGVRRNDIAFLRAGTQNCTTPDRVQVALIAFGYLSGLENNNEPSDPMFYPPDFTSPSQAFEDVCATIVPTLDDEGMPNLPVCVSVYHETHCNDVPDTINSRAELLAVYGAGPAAEDVEPPIVEAVGIGGEMDVPSGTQVPFTARITDNGGFVFVRWTLRNERGVLADYDSDGDGAICKSHNAVCEVEFIGDVPYQQDPDGNYDADEVASLPDGIYEVTLEAADLAGNAIVPITATITVGAGGGTTGVDPDSGDPTLDGGDADTLVDEGDGDGSAAPDPDDGDLDGDDEGPGDEADDDGTTTSAGATGGIASRGCSCGTIRNDSAWLLVGLFALGRRRRR